ncbi:MAG: hypothetical protein ACYC26_07280 [Phycisphaerales bacterium]
MSIVIPASGLVPEQRSPLDGLVVAAVFFLFAYTANLQVRHIDSIKARRHNEAT